MTIRFDRRLTRLILAVAFALAGLHSVEGANSNVGQFTVIHFFDTGYSDAGPLTEVTPGVFFGILGFGNSQSGSASFQLTSDGSYQTIYEFPQGWDAYNVSTRAVNGRFYGRFALGPNDVFSTDLGGNAVFYSFGSVNAAPELQPQLPDGTLYGIQFNEPCTPNCGFFSRMDLTGNVTHIHTFTASEGYPYGLPILATDGNFYGISGYDNGNASVYRITPKGNATVLMTYYNGAAFTPVTLIQASNGKLYGTSPSGGTKQGGMIFELTLDGKFRILHQFDSNLYGMPSFLMEASDGNLYGSAYGQVNLGGFSSLFRLTPDGKYDRIHVFVDPNKAQCYCYMTQGLDGRVYGTAAAGGPFGGGSAWTYDLGLPKPLPKLINLTPHAGAIGSRVIVSGKYLLGTTSVTFNGTPATSFGNITAEYVYADVPAGATTGPVTITTPNGTETSNNAFVIQ